VDALIYLPALPHHEYSVIPMPFPIPIRGLPGRFPSWSCRTASSIAAEPKPSVSCRTDLSIVEPKPSGSCPNAPSIAEPKPSGSCPTTSSIADTSPSGPARDFCPPTDVAEPKPSGPATTCEIAICMPIFYKTVMLGRWYVIPIGVDADGMFISEERTIKPFCEGNHSFDFTFAALGSTIYCFGPDDSVFKLGAVGPMTDRWIRAPSMNTHRNQPHKWVLGSKLYLLGSDRRDLEMFAEVFDPVINKWVVLPEPPYEMSYFIVSAALENPNRILVALTHRHRVRAVLMIISLLFSLFMTSGMEIGRRLSPHSARYIAVVLSDCLEWHKP
jgi:hypothetical protein